jgi:peptide/nickel transport system ATP-binding protein
VSLVEVRGLRVELAATGRDIVDGVSFAIEAGEVLAIVGESGSGKTTIGTAILGYIRPGGRLVSGSVVVDGHDVVMMDSRELRELRGGVVSYIPQDPGAALNPARRIGEQIDDVLHAHLTGASGQERRGRIETVIREVTLPSDRAFLRRYPHQLSGGQQQRVCIAMAFAALPRVVVLDEPTTGLDVTTQGRVLATVRQMCETHRVAALYITHDLAVVSNLAQRVMVLYAGRVAELGPREVLFNTSAHPYTRKLVAAIPDPSMRRELDPIPGAAPGPATRPWKGCRFAPRCELALERCRQEEPASASIASDHLAWCYRAGEVAAFAATAPTVALSRRSALVDAVLEVKDLRVSYGQMEVVKGITFVVQAGECVALVGESGSGKTTVARAIMGLTQPRSGQLFLRSDPLPPSSRARSQAARRALQYVFQNPFASLNPRRTVGEAIAVPLEHLTQRSRREVRAAVAEALERVSLPAGIANQLPAQLSGGERQRVAIARALVSDPQVLVCDEITSSLDVSVQAAIMQLLARLQADEQHLALLFITHNLGLVRSVADRVLVMQEGEIVESGGTDELFTRPRHAYTTDLLANTPTMGLTAGDLTAK